MPRALVYPSAPVRTRVPSVRLTSKAHSALVSAASASLRQDTPLCRCYKWDVVRAAAPPLHSDQALQTAQAVPTAGKYWRSRHGPAPTEVTFKRCRLQEHTLEIEAWPSPYLSHLHAWHVLNGRFRRHEGSCAEIGRKRRSLNVISTSSILLFIS